MQAYFHIPIRKHKHIKLGSLSRKFSLSSLSSFFFFFWIDDFVQSDFDFGWIVTFSHNFDFNKYHDVHYNFSLGGIYKLKFYKFVTTKKIPIEENWYFIEVKSNQIMDFLEKENYNLFKKIINKKYKLHISFAVSRKNILTQECY